MTTILIPCTKLAQLIVIAIAASSLSTQKLLVDIVLQVNAWVLPGRYIIAVLYIAMC